MKILVTGSAGFIGFHLCYTLLKKKNIKIVGVDNINDYYSVKLKKLRLSKLRKYKNFSFYKIDISNYKKLDQLFRIHKFDIVVNLAAQAGVRYSIQKPSEFMSSNFLGFFNIIDLSKNYKIKKFFYASSSSVYGEQKLFPSTEKNDLLPKNIYSLSKKNNEDIANIYHQLYGLKSLGLRFFTVYGEWGRPDMLMMKYMIAKKKNSYFILNDKGKHFRDFTYIQDVNIILKKLIFSKLKKGHDVVNICSNRPLKVKEILYKINDLYGKPKIKYHKKLNVEVDKTHGTNTKIKKLTKFINFTDIDHGLKKLVGWSKKYLKSI